MEKMYNYLRQLKFDLGQYDCAKCSGYLTVISSNALWIAEDAIAAAGDRDQECGK
jgi:hypothetical protein